MTRTFLFFLLPFFLSGCAFHGGSMTGNAAISDAKFTVVGLATGTSSTVHVFGIGGLRTEGMVLEAKRNLYLNYPLAPGQALANVTVDFKRAFYVFVVKTTCIISADIIDFSDDPQNADFADYNQSISKNSLLESKGFVLSEKVIFYDGIKVRYGTITEFPNQSHAKVRVKRKDGVFLHEKMPLYVLYKTVNDKYVSLFSEHLRIGDKVMFSIHSGIEKEGIIIGLSQNEALIEFRNTDGSVRIFEKQHKYVKTGTGK